MQLTEEKKQALIFSLSRQASLMHENALDLTKLGNDNLTSLSEQMIKQAEDVRDIALFIDEKL